MESPSPFPRRGRPPVLEDEELPETVERSIKLAGDFDVWFREAAAAEGVSWHHAARLALAEWARKHHPKA